MQSDDSFVTAKIHLTLCESTLYFVLLYPAAYVIGYMQIMVLLHPA